MWLILSQYEIPQEILSFTKEMRKSFTCNAVHKVSLRWTKVVKSGDKQGCILLLTMVLVATDSIVENVTEGKKKGNYVAV